MNGRYRHQEQVPSSSGSGSHTVSQRDSDGEWECDCLGWTRHVPRRDCKHVLMVKARLGQANAGAATSKAAKLTATAVAAAAQMKPEERAAVEARLRREGVAVKRLSALRQLRYGFQLAHPYEPEDLNHGEWVAEVKYDGDLAMLIDGRLINRSGNDVTLRFPEIDTVAWDAGVVLVGELVVIENGLSVFKRIQERATDDPIKIRAASKQHPARFMAFDMLEFNSAPLDQLAARVRRAQMEQWFDDFGEDLEVAGIDLVEQLPVGTPGEVEALVEACRKLETEGIMLKNLDAPYVAQRGRNWVKAKAWLEEEFEVVRYEDTGVGGGWVFYIQSGAHEQRIVCNSAAMKRVIVAGHERFLDGLRQSPLDGTPLINAPRMKVEVKYLSKGADGALRFPSLRRVL